MAIPIWLLILIGYAMMSWQTAAAIFADCQHLSSQESAERDYRQDLGITWLFAILPPIWLATPFVTGFWKHGWNWTFAHREPESDIGRVLANVRTEAGLPILPAYNVPVTVQWVQPAPPVSDHSYTTLSIYHGEGCAICGRPKKEHVNR